MIVPAADCIVLAGSDGHRVHGARHEPVDCNRRRGHREHFHPVEDYPLRPRSRVRPSEIGLGCAIVGRLQLAASDEPTRHNVTRPERGDRGLDLNLGHGVGDRARTAQRGDVKCEAPRHLHRRA